MEQLPWILWWDTIHLAHLAIWYVSLIKIQIAKFACCSPGARYKAITSTPQGKRIYRLLGQNVLSCFTSIST